MWGHYANRHHGICIEYNTKDPIFVAVEKVKYTNVLPKLKINTLSDLKHESLTQQFIKNICTKEIRWNYENEYRLFDITRSGIYKLLPGSVNSIYMGLFCSLEDEGKIRKALSYQSVRYYRIELNTIKYKIEFYEV